MKKTQILYVPSRPIIIRHPETREILKKVDSIKEAGNILNMDYRTLRRLFKKHSLQELGVPQEWKNKYNISYAIWEKCENIEEIEPKNLKEFYQDYPFIRPNVKSINRIGPHSEKIISIIFGTLLGDSYGERRKYSVKGGIRKGGTRITFQQEDSNREYLMKFWKDVAEMGYCRNQEPNMLTRIGKNGKIRWYYKVHTWTFTSLNWIQELFYDEKNRKFVPKKIGRFLTPRALAYWFMDDGSRSSGGVKFNTNSFTYEDVEFLGTVLKEKYNLDCTVQSAGVKNQYNLYILKNSMQDFNNIVRPYMVKSK